MSATIDPDASSSSRPDRPGVLVVTPQPFYEDRGTPIALRQTVSALCEMGYAVDMLAFPFGSDVHIDGLRMHRSAGMPGIDSVPIGFSWKKLLLDMSLLQAFRRRLAVKRYDIVHAVEEAAFMASLLCPRHGVPYVYDMASSIPAELRSHPLLGTAPVQRLLAAAERRAIAGAAHVLCSGGLARHVREQVGRAAVSEWVFPAVFKAAESHVAAQVRASLGFDVRHRVIVYSGNFAEYQNIDTLMQAFGIAQRQDESLRLVCIGATEAEREAWIRMLDARTASKVHIVTRRPRHEIPAYLSMADCLVSLRLQGDNLPLKVFEYMASGIPIVATRGPAHESMLNEQCAYLCGGSAEAVAEALLAAVHAPPERAASIGGEARRHAARHFGWDAFKDLVCSTYQRALKTAPHQVSQPL